MRLSLSQASRIANNYNLGKVLSVKYIPAGWDNYSFDLRTSKGKFIVQVFGHSLTKVKREELDFQSRFLHFLKSKKFPLEVPAPIMSKRSSLFMSLDKKKLWVYKKILGVVDQSMTENKFIELSKTIALFHKFSSKFKTGTCVDFKFSFLEREFIKFRKVAPNSKLNKLMLENLDFFTSLLSSLKKIDYGKKFNVCHADFSGNNVIYRDNRIVGIIDFNNLEVAPISQELAINLCETSIRLSGLRPERMKVLLREYRKVRPFSKKEESLIVPLILKQYCHLFWWQFDGMRKQRHLRFRELEETIKKTKRLVKQFKYEIK